MNIPELHDIENTDFVDEMTYGDCAAYLFEKLNICDLSIIPVRTAKFRLEAVMHDGDTFTRDGDTAVEAMRKLTKKCIDHYLLIN